MNNLCILLPVYVRSALWGLADAPYSTCLEKMFIGDCEGREYWSRNVLSMVECIPSYSPVFHCEVIGLARLRNPRATLPISELHSHLSLPTLEPKKNLHVSFSIIF